MERAGRIAATVLTVAALGTSLGAIVGSAVEIFQHIGLSSIVLGHVGAAEIVEACKGMSVGLIATAASLLLALFSCACGAHRKVQLALAGASLATLSASAVIPAGAGYLLKGGIPSAAFLIVAIVCAVFAASALSSM